MDQKKVPLKEEKTKVVRKKAKRAGKSATKPANKKKVITKNGPKFHGKPGKKARLKNFYIEGMALVSLLKGVHAKNLEQLVLVLMDEMDTPMRKSFARKVSEKAGVDSGLSKEDKKMIAFARRIRRSIESI